MPERMLSAEHPIEVWAALGASVSLIFTLVAVLYNRLNEDRKADSLRLDNGQATFSEIGKQLAVISEQMISLGKGTAFTDEEIDRLELDIKQLNNRLTVIETEHKGCMGRRAYDKTN